MDKEIDNDNRLDDITLIKHLKGRNSIFLDDIAKVYNAVKDILNTRIPHIFQNYTLHNVDHSFRIMEYMSKIVGDINSLNDLEITILIYSALLHDIGMAVSEEDLELIKTDSYPHSDIKFSAMLKFTAGNENLALQEYVRRIHATLSAKYILANHKDQFTIPKLNTLSFSKELANICKSHTENYDWIKRNLTTYEVRGDFYFNPQFIAIVLRLADILDIDSNRTPYNLYKIIAPMGFSDNEWKQHFIISNNEKIILNEKTQQKKIVFHGKATNPSIHRKLLTYIGWVENELINGTAISNNMLPQYRLFFDNHPEINIQTEGYTFSDYKMTLDFKAISSLLMGEKIYGSKTLGLRELVQNSMDSCRVRQEIEKAKYEFGQEPYKGKIKIILDEEKNQVIIKDNGTGMSLDIIKKHFLNIGLSFYNSPTFLLKDYNYKPIGNFGIGFLSCFMLSNDVKVVTRYFNSKYKYIIELEQGNEYTSLTELEDVSFDGTEVQLAYTSFIKIFKDDIKNVIDFLNSYFLTDEVDFEVIDKSKQWKVEISNPLRSTQELEKGCIKIDLGKYLNEIEGYVILKPKTPFVNHFSDLNFDEHVYVYTELGGIEKIEDFSSLQIDDYLDDKELTYLSIPIVDDSNEEDYLNGIKFTDDDVDEVIRKMDRDLTWVSVLFRKDLAKLLVETTIESGDTICEQFDFNMLCAIGHSDSCSTKAFLKKINLFEGECNKLYLPFEEKDKTYNFYYYPRTKDKRELYIRNVLLKDFHYDIRVTASIFEINSLVVNISSRKFIPDISRNNIQEGQADLINYLLGKAIHRAIYDVMKMDAGQKNTFQKFLTHFYLSKSEFDK